MKRLILCCLLAAFVLPLHASEKKMVRKYNTITRQWSSYPLVTIHDIQYVRPESLALADAIQLTQPSRWTLQTSSYMGDTVVVHAVCITPNASDPPNPGLTFTQHGWTMLLHDPTPANAWTGALARVGSTGGIPDTSIARTNHWDQVSRGDLIEMTVVVEEFPTLSMNSTTQLRPIPGIDVVIIGSGAIPPPTLRSVTDFYSGGYPGGTVNYSNGEQFEASLVKLKNLKVNSIINAPRGTWAMTDPSGNYLADYDASHYFTLGNENPVIPGDTSFHVPPIGAVIDTISGTMLTVSGAENPRGYRICPLFPGDVQFGVTLPRLFSHRRYPVFVSSVDSVRIEVKVNKQAGGYDIYKAVLLKSIDNGPWIADTMTRISADSIYRSYLIDYPDGNPYPANTAVRYFVKALDVQGNQEILANAGSDGSSDTNKGFFFFTVLDRPYTIRDIQYTPYSNGRSPYVGSSTDLVTVKGIVTADTTDLGLTPLNTGGTNAWYIQDGTAPWSGIWVVSRDSTSRAHLSALRRGDSVAVTGSVQENFDVTRILDSTVSVLATGRPVPAPVLITTGTFGNRGNGSPVAEPYEGMLIKVVSTTVSDTALWTFIDRTEYTINDGTGSMVVRRDGHNSYGNREPDTSLGYTRILFQTDPIDTMIGVGYYSFSRYKITPRKDNDYAAGDPFKYAAGWNLTSLGRRQMPTASGNAYKLATLFPGATSNAFYFTTTYVPTTNIEPRKGYWVKFAGPTTIRQFGERRTRDTISVLAGWNMIGAPGKAVLTSSVSFTPPGNHLSQFFEYSGGYIVQDSLLPSKGYWVKADSNGTIYVTATSNMPRSFEPVVSEQTFNTLTLSDKDGNSQTLYFGEDANGTMRMTDFEMPPSSPEESGFSARYASNRILEAYPSVIKSGLEYPIMATLQNGPLTVSWNIVSQDNKIFTMAGRELSGTGSMQVNKSGSVRLSLEINGGAAVPKQYSLSQNYPNPFNPTTKFIIGLPQAAHLEVAVYNILGQRVATLVDEMREAGYQTVTWNGTTHLGAPAASGIYFVRMSAASTSSGSAQPFTSVRKIMLMK